MSPAYLPDDPSVAALIGKREGGYKAVADKIGGFFVAKTPLFTCCIIFD